MTEEEAIVEGLPPLMGFPSEEYHDGAKISVPYYTCLIGPFRVFVYCPSGIADKGWLVERKVDLPTLVPQRQFFDSHHLDRYEIIHSDPIMLMAIIWEITSESNEDAARPTGSDDNVLAPHE
jgi:hypothetical protein